MSHQVYAFEPPERFVVGTVGEPGERTFYLQASGGGRLVSVALEKVQVSLLADKLDELLGEASRRFGVPLAEPGSATVDNDPLATPVDEEFRVGTLGLAFDVKTSTVVIEAIEVGDGRRGRGAGRGSRPAPGAHHPGGHACVHRTGASGGRRRAAAVPAVRPAAEPSGPHLPPAQRLPPQLDRGLSMRSEPLEPGWPRTRWRS